ncbi:MAG: DUF4349 domain-containing protein [Candidatus Bathyarchaeia archaeon]
MKTLIPNSSRARRLVGLFIIVFVVASAVVGYEGSLAAPVMSSASPGGYGAVNGPVVPGVPGVNQQLTFFSTTAATGTVPAGSYSTSFGGRMVEQEGDLTIQVNDVKAASDQAARLAALFNGYVASSSFDDSGSGASIVLRVPEGNFSAALHSLSSLGSVKAQSISSNDVTEQYVNLQAQLDSYTTEEAALLRILNSSKTVTDALGTENALQNTQAQINDLEGQLRVMQRLVAFGTINVQLVQPAANATLDFGDALNSALLAFYTVTRGMLILGASLVPVAMVGGIAYVPYRHFSRRKSKPIEAK